MHTKNNYSNKKMSNTWSGEKSTKCSIGCIFIQKGDDDGSCIVVWMVWAWKSVLAWSAKANSYQIRIGFSDGCNATLLHHEVVCLTSSKREQRLNFSSRLAAADTRSSSVLLSSCIYALGSVVFFWSRLMSIDHVRGLDDMVSRVVSRICPNTRTY